ncbi:MAG: SDR family NAD(P)-dependent oxidoreductase, partial [Candidatus Bathyarchaeia archaeon]
MAAEGARVVVATRTENNGKETVKIIRSRGGDAVFVQTDVSRAEEAQRAINTAVDTYKKCDILFNNAGIEGHVAEVKDLSEKEWEEVLSVNLKGVFLMSKYAIPEMIKVHGGAIINNSSTFGHVGSAKWGPYCTSKAGVLGLTRVLALECARYNIRVNAICPGGTLTEMHPRYLTTKELEDAHRARHPLGRFGTPEEIARAVIFLASEESSFMTGSSLTVDGGYTSV